MNNVSRNDFPYYASGIIIEKYDSFIYEYFTTTIDSEISYTLSPNIYLTSTRKVDYRIKPKSRKYGSYKINNDTISLTIEPYKDSNKLIFIRNFNSRKLTLISILFNWRSYVTKSLIGF